MALKWSHFPASGILISTLQCELGVNPDPAKRQAYKRLLQHETPVIPARAQPALLAATPTLIGRKPEWRLCKRSGMLRVLRAANQASLNSCKMQSVA